MGIIRPLVWMLAILALAFALTALSIALTARSALNRAAPASAPLVVVLSAGTAADGTLGARTIPWKAKSPDSSLSDRDGAEPEAPRRPILLLADHLVVT